jgi:hypothetical protein
MNGLGRALNCSLKHLDRLLLISRHRIVPCNAPLFSCCAYRIEAGRLRFCVDEGEP